MDRDQRAAAFTPGLAARLLVPICAVLMVVGMLVVTAVVAVAVGCELAARRALAAIR